MIAKIICFFKTHKWFSYVGDTTAPEGEHSLWCGRCGSETTVEELERERKARLYANMALYGRYI